MFKKQTKTAEKTPTIGLAQVGSELVIAWMMEDGGAKVLEGCFRASCSNVADGGKVLSEWVKEFNLSGARVNFILEPGRYNLYLLETPDAEPGELQNALRWRVKDYLDYDIEDAIIDHIALPSKQSAEAVKMGYAVAANRKHVDEAVHLIESSDLVVNAIEIAETGLRNVGVCLAEQQDGIAYLHLAEHESQLILIRKDNIHLMRKVDINMKHIFSPDEVDKNMWDVYQERFVNDLVLEVQRSVDYCSSALRQTPAKQLIIGPVPVELDDVSAAIQDGLGLPVHLKGFKNVIKCRKPITPLDQNHCLYALGGALRQEDTES